MKFSSFFCENILLTELFGLNATSGEVYTTMSLEKQNGSYLLGIEARDGGVVPPPLGYTIENMTIYIDDASNDRPYITYPESGNKSGISIPEVNASINSCVYKLRGWYFLFAGNIILISLSYIWLKIRHPSIYKGDLCLYNLQLWAWLFIRIAELLIIVQNISFINSNKKKIKKKRSKADV